MRICVLGLYVLVFFGCSKITGQNPSALQIKAETETLLLWKIFWEGPQSIDSYRPGQTVDAAIVRSGDEITVFIGDLRTTIFLKTERGEIVKRAIGGMRMANTTAAVERYLSDHGGTPGFVLKPGVPGQPPGAPIRQDSSEPKTTPQIRNIRLKLPPLAPPASVLSNGHPAELAALVEGVRKGLSGFRSAKCTGAFATIPLFSVQDPVVYVYVDFGKTCEKGIVALALDATGWRTGQFLPSRPPNDWSYTVSQIQKYSLSTVPLFQ